MTAAVFLVLLVVALISDAAPAPRRSAQASTPPGTASAVDSASISAAEKARDKALRNADVKALSELLDPEYIHVDSNGRIRTKAEFLGAIAQQAVILKRLHIASTDIRVLGDCALVTGQFTIETVTDGQNVTVTARYLRVWTKVDGRWRNVAHQITPLRRGAPWP